MIKKYLPLDVSEFPTMILGNYVYIDKTEYIYNLFSRGGRYFFLSRPRRFGKSLLISTLKELFLGNKKLFENLWISTSDYKWQEHPIVHLDFSNIAHGTVNELKDSLIWTLSNIAKDYDIDISQAPTLPDKFVDLIKKLSLINKVVILIDEYDKPILDHIKNLEEADRQREVLKSFYDAIKGLGLYLRAFFVTGVSRFSKTSLFSGLNNLNDISLDPDAAPLLGYTQHEIEERLAPHLEDFAKERAVSTPELLLDLKKWYNGYRFSRKELYVYNPFSVLYAVQKKEFVNYWYLSGTPTFLIHLIEKQYNSIEDINTLEFSQESLGNFAIDKIPLIPLLFQTGYLTISDYDQKTNKFKLDFPNFEVERSFTQFFVETLTQSSNGQLNRLSSQLIHALNTNDLAQFCSILTALFAHVPYTLIKKQEDYYHILFQFLLSLLSLESQSEILTNKGRIDLVLSTATHTYIFELKLNTSPEIALAQIKQRGYYERFLHQGKEVVLVGLAFTPKDKESQLKCIHETL